jgi:hydroxyethylthiazole kinase-like uncharacterized protein yjeF
MRPLFSVAEIRSIEHAALTALPAGTLMRRAGNAAAQRACALFDPADATPRILVLAGPGNNGGDALEAATVLTQQGIPVEALLVAEPSAGDAAQALQRAVCAGVQFIEPDIVFNDTAGYALVIDGLFGIGLTRPVSGIYRDLVGHVNALRSPVLALDVPSGLNADAGTVIGPDGIAIRASHTITFIADKPGLHTCDGRDYAGEISVEPLDIASDSMPAALAWLNGPDGFASSLRPRRHNTHKGSFGDVIVVGGAPGMAGATILAARAALYCGAGRVLPAFIDMPPAYDMMQPELMCRAAADIEFSRATVAIGPGLGRTPFARQLLATALAAAVPLVVDADALNMLAADTALQTALAQRDAPALLTPHPLEAARLLGCSAADVQSDRLHAARTLARRLRSITILKGSGTVITAPDGEAVVNPTGNPALATAGTGDVLTGICAALLAQDCPPWHAALAAVWLHGAGADHLLANGIGPAGVTAGELIPAVRAVLNRLASS